MSRIIVADDSDTDDDGVYNVRRPTADDAVRVFVELDIYSRREFLERLPLEVARVGVAK